MTFVKNVTQIINCWISSVRFYLNFQFLDTCSDNKWNYKKAFELFPQMKIFIEIFAKKLDYENKMRLKLEEKTLNLLSNDFKTIDNLVKMKNNFFRIKK
jgi:hypothetical protein